MKLQVVSVSKDKLDKIRRRVKSCQELFKTMFESHKDRIEYEKGGSVQNAPITVRAYTKKAIDPKPPEGVLKFTYSARGATDEEFRKLGETVFADLKEELERNHKQKIVAIDIDGKNIVASEYERDNVIQAMHQSNSTGRIMMRRIGKDERIAIEIY